MEIEEKSVPILSLAEMKRESGLKKKVINEEVKILKKLKKFILEENPNKEMFMNSEFQEKVKEHEKKVKKKKKKNKGKAKNVQQEAYETLFANELGEGKDKSYKKDFYFQLVEIWDRENEIKKGTEELDKLDKKISRLEYVENINKLANILNRKQGLDNPNNDISLKDLHAWMTGPRDPKNENSTQRIDTALEALSKKKKKEFKAIVDKLIKGNAFGINFDRPKTQAAAERNGISNALENADSQQELKISSPEYVENCKELASILNGKQVSDNSENKITLQEVDAWITGPMDRENKNIIDRFTTAFKKLSKEDQGKFQTTQTKLQTIYASDHGTINELENAVASPENNKNVDQGETPSILGSVDGDLPPLPENINFNVTFPQSHDQDSTVDRTNEGPYPQVDNVVDPKSSGQVIADAKKPPPQPKRPDTEGNITGSNGTTVTTTVRKDRLNTTYSQDRGAYNPFADSGSTSGEAESSGQGKNKVPYRTPFASDASEGEMKVSKAANALKILENGLTEDKGADKQNKVSSFQRWFGFIRPLKEKASRKKKTSTKSPSSRKKYKTIGRESMQALLKGVEEQRAKENELVFIRDSRGLNKFVGENNETINKNQQKDRRKVNMNDLIKLGEVPSTGVVSNERGIAPPPVPPRNPRKPSF